jgi:hypothetical protein
LTVPSLPLFYRNKENGRRKAYYNCRLVPCAVESKNHPNLILTTEEAEAAAIPPPPSVAESPPPKKAEADADIN